MRRSLTVLAAALAVTVITAGVAQALPGESPANTRGVNGRVWSVVVVGNVVWVGGTFSGITNGDNTTVVKNSPRLAAFTLGGAPAEGLSHRSPPCSLRLPSGSPKSSAGSAGGSKRQAPNESSRRSR